MKILLVEDDPRMSDLVREVLEDAHYLVDVAADGDTADEHMAVNAYDLVILDWEVPGASGIELLRGWRSEGHQLPILMLTGRHEIADRTGGLDAGADDYLVKPFAFRELLARVRSLLRRRRDALSMVLKAGDLQLDSAAHEVTLSGEKIELRPKEFAVLEVLMRRVDNVVSRADLEDHAWDSASDAIANVVDVTIFRLRKKIDRGRPRKLLHTIRGAGYVLRSERV